jgi:ATP-dependent RNA helicase DDX49/DBP8
VLTTDDLLRRQEEPARKKLKITLGFDGLDGTGSELGDETSDSEERLNDELQRGARRDRKNTGDEEDDDVLVEGEDEESLTSGDSDSEFSFTLDGKNRSDFRRVKTRPISQRPPKSLGTTFASLGISAPLQASLTAMSIRTPTEVQAACIPPLLAGQ